MAQNVQVILARDVANLGRLGELVSVRPGYARNFLVPQALAMPASSSRVAQFAHQKKLVEHKRRLLRVDSDKKAKEMGDVVVTLTAKVGEQGKLFGAITGRDISRALTAIGHSIHHKDIKLEEPIRTIGSYTLEVRLEGDVTTSIKVVVAPEVDANAVVAAPAEAAAVETAEA